MLPRISRPVRRRAALYGVASIVLVVFFCVVALLEQRRLTLASARETVLKEQLFRLRNAISRFEADRGAMPRDLRALIEERYMRSIPIDPVTGRSDTWVLVYNGCCGMGEEFAPCDLGMFDVRSGADGVSSGGKAFSEL